MTQFYLCRDCNFAFPQAINPKRCPQCDGPNVVTCDTEPGAGIAALYNIQAAVDQLLKLLEERP